MSSSSDDASAVEGGNPYLLLNIKPNASQKEIRKAYFALARHVHPDRNPSPDAVQAFQTLDKAYSILKDPEKRQLFDRTGCTDQDSDQFWEAYQHYRSVYPEVTTDDLDAFAKTYQHSEEEKSHLLQFYQEKKGDLTLIMAYIMCSQPSDATRFVAFFESEIEKNTLQRTGAFDRTRHTCGETDLDNLDNMEQEDGEDLQENEVENEMENEMDEDDGEDGRDLDDFIVHDDDEEEEEEVVVKEVVNRPAKRERPAKENSKSKNSSQSKNSKSKKKKTTRKESAAASKPKKGRGGSSTTSSSSSSKSDSSDSMDALRAMIMQKGRERHDDMIDRIASKYKGK